ncbi:MAG: AzlD domain-containing protein [Ruminococcaceae bacterium]|nr:AzlD domain-containing protein [Oscillospiraceae bacterium]
MKAQFWILLVVMAVTTYLVRMIPFTFFSAKIKSKYIRDVLYYIPYAVLGAMTIPHIFYSGGSTQASVVGAVVAFVMAFFRFSLIAVAVTACVVAYFSGMIL